MGRMRLNTLLTQFTKKENMMQIKKTIVAVALAALLGACGGISPEEASKQGFDSLGLGDLRAASISFKAALREDPNMVSARLGLAKVSFSTRDFTGASSELNKALNYASESEKQEIRTLLARAYYNSESSQLILDMDDNISAEVDYYLTMTNIASKDVKAARTRNLGGKPFDELSRFVIGSLDVEPQVALDSAPSFDNPNDVLQSELLIVKQQLALRANNVESAIESLLKYVEINPGDDRRSLQLSHMQILEGDYTGPSGRINDLLSRYPTNALINELASVVAYEGENYSKAIATASIATAENARKIMPRLVAAYSSLRLEDPVGALNNLSFVIDELPEIHPAQRLYVRLKAGQGDLLSSAKKALTWESLSKEDVSLVSTLGLELLQQGDVEQAEALAKKAGEAGENDVALGMLQFSLNQSDQAFLTLESALAEDPESEIILNSLASAYLAAEKYAEAKTLANNWIASSEQSKQVEGYMLSGIVYARQGDHDSAIMSFEKVQSLSPESYMAQAGIIESLVNQGKVSQAETLLKSNMLKGGNFYQLFRNYLSALRSGDGGDGVNRAAKTLQRWVDDGTFIESEPKLQLAQAWFLSRDFEKSQVALDSIINDYVERPDYWLLRATVSEQLGDNAKLRFAFTQWSQLDETAPLPLMGLVRLDVSSGEINSAIERLENVIPQLEDAFPARLVLSQLFLRTGNSDGLRRQVALIPQDRQSIPIVQGFSGVVDVQRGNLNVGESKLKVAVEALQNAEFLRWLVSAQERQGKRIEVVETLEKFLIQSPDNDFANFILGNHAVSDKSYEKAVEYYTLSLKSGKNAVVLNNLAYTHMELGGLELAEQYAKDAIAIAPDIPSYIDTYANVLIKLGRQNEAITLMEELLSRGVKANDAFSKTLIKAKSKK
jgi:putative PEP-CTERM system TPR-repeat lipoprotein